MGVALQAIKVEHRSCTIRQCTNGLLKAYLLIGGLPVFNLQLIDIQAVLKVLFTTQIADSSIGRDSIQPATKGTVAPEFGQITPSLMV